MDFHMRESRVLRKMREGKVATSIKVNMGDARIAEMAARCGFDCIWVDLEHTPDDMRGIENIIRAAKNYDTDVLTRVSKGSYSDFVRPLEADSAGIMIPHVMSLEEAKKIVYYTKFHPIGRRPIDGGNSDGAFCLINSDTYMKEANANRFTVIQIEDPEPLDELEEIAALPGIDMLFFGPADFSQGMGIPGQFKDPRITETRKRIAECARRNGKFAGTVGGKANQGELIDMGYQFINLGSDVRALANYFLDITESCSNKDAKKYPF